MIRNALQDDAAPLLEVAQVGEAFFESAELRVVKTAGGFLAVAGDEWDGGLVIQERDGCSHLRNAHAQLFGDSLCY